ncbi:anoctamin-7-like [Hyposmocoma kahamanoa]|uniref:anoctamin-7-like n=1 Tax=Hyposmocoma kahamanoa TaxID=1477025 RepID=UPI000E6D86FF|nr:anoctamin-7-like [Hyposmocoma kahamanoa]
MRHKIILDGFALHDGPYFITETQQMSNVNGRQILYYKWAQYKAMLSSQPLSVINEYFGPKLANFFAFYQFYIWMLMFMVPISMCMLLPAWRVLRNLLVGEGANMYCQAHKLAVRHLCPSCLNFNACPLRNLSDFCEVHKFVRLTQRIMIMSPIFTLWCVLFFFFWKRKQNYWRWLWEIKPKPRHPIVRAEHELMYRKAKRSKSTGVWITTMSRLKILERIIGPFLVVIAIAIPFLATITIYAYNISILKNTSFLMHGIVKNNTKMLKYRDYIALAIVLPIHFVFCSLIEAVFLKLSPIMTRWENHRLVKNYERSLTYRYFAVSLIYTFPCMIFVSWIKGRFFTHPLEHWNTVVNITTPFFHANISMPFLGHLMYFHCNKTINCIDEMVFTFVLLSIYVLIVQSLKSVFRFFPNMFTWTITDFNLAREKEFNAPEWEREFKLKPLTDEDVLKWTNQIMTQLAVFAWFGHLAPYISILFLIFNMVMLRYVNYL